MTSIKETTKSELETTREVETSVCDSASDCDEMPALLPPQPIQNPGQLEIEETWTVRNGFKISISIPLNWEWCEYNSNRGPSHCETCRTDGMFEGVFYGLFIVGWRKKMGTSELSVAPTLANL